MNCDEAFNLAISLIHSLPCRDTASFWKEADRGGARNLAQWTEVSHKLEEFSYKVPDEKAHYFLLWASDAAVGAGDLQRGLDLLPIPRIGGKSKVLANQFLGLKAELGVLPSARDITALFGPKVTPFGKQNLEAIEQYIQLQIDQSSKAGCPMNLEAWSDDAYWHPAGYDLFSGHPSYIVTTPPVGRHFEYSKKAEQDCVTLIRDAENAWRMECDLPRVGEGWVSETRLYYQIKTAFPHLEVLQHHRPSWLGRQHFDISIPSLSVAIEYQGAQHDQPVAYFGGEAAFRKTVDRDKRKLNLCRRHGWKLIYAREGYYFPDIVKQISINNMDM